MNARRIAKRIVGRAVVMTECPECGRTFDNEYDSRTCLDCDRGEPQVVGMDEIDTDAEQRWRGQGAGAPRHDMTTQRKLQRGRRRGKGPVRATDGTHNHCQSCGARVPTDSLISVDRGTGDGGLMSVCPECAPGQDAGNPASRRRGHPGVHSGLCFPSRRIAAPTAEALLKRARSAIERDEDFIYDVAAETGQQVANVRHMPWFVKAVANWLIANTKQWSRLSPIAKRIVGGDETDTSGTYNHCQSCGKRVPTDSLISVSRGTGDGGLMSVCPECDTNRRGMRVVAEGTDTGNSVGNWSGGWLNGEWKCPECGTIIGRNLKGETPAGLVRQHECAGGRTIPDDGYADGGAPYTDEEMDILTQQASTPRSRSPTTGEPKRGQSSPRRR